MIDKILEKTPGQLIFYIKLIIIFNVALTMVLLVTDSIFSKFDFMLIIATIGSMVILLFKNEMSDLKAAKNMLKTVRIVTILLMVAIYFSKLQTTNINTFIFASFLLVEKSILLFLIDYYINKKSIVLKAHVDLKCEEKEIDIGQIL